MIVEIIPTHPALCLMRVSSIDSTTTGRLCTGTGSVSATAHAAPLSDRRKHRTCRGSCANSSTLIQTTSERESSPGLSLALFRSLNIDICHYVECLNDLRVLVERAATSCPTRAYSHQAGRADSAGSGRPSMLLVLINIENAKQCCSTEHEQVQRSPSHTDHCSVLALRMQTPRSVRLADKFPAT